MMANDQLKVSKWCMCLQTFAVGCMVRLFGDESKFLNTPFAVWNIDRQKGKLVRSESADLSHRFQPEMPSLETAMPMLRELSSATPSYHITNLRITNKA